jgi:hypothetical protein
MTLCSSKAEVLNEYLQPIIIRKKLNGVIKLIIPHLMGKIVDLEGFESAAN